eukprot:UN11171
MTEERNEAEIQQSNCLLQENVEEIEKKLRSEMEAEIQEIKQKMKANMQVEVEEIKEISKADLSKLDHTWEAKHREVCEDRDSLIARCEKIRSNERDLQIK